MKATASKTSPTKASSHKGRKKAAAAEPIAAHPRPSMGDPDREQDLPAGEAFPDLDNDMVHKTARPEGPVLEDDDLDGQLAEEHETDRDEDVSEANPLHVGHFVGR